jgi:hypothetical protein
MITTVDTTGQELVEMPTARPEFADLSEAVVWEAVNYKLDSNPIAAEVVRLAIDYMRLFNGSLTQYGYVPARILCVGVRSPIEKVALLMVVKFVEAEAVAAGVLTLH